MGSLKKFDGSSWVNSNLRKLTAETDTFTALPAIIYAEGTNANVGLKGNTVQSGTPTPDNPVMPQGTGDRTGNLFDGDYTVAVMSVSGNTVTLNTASSGRVVIAKCEPNTTYTVKKYSVSNRFIIAESDIKPANGTAMSLIQNDSSKSEYTFTTSNTAQYVAIYYSTSSEQAEPQLMLNPGSTPLPYEPYGYKIPISSAGQTTPVYLGEVQTTRRVKKFVFDGTEKWQLYNRTASVGGKYFNLPIATQERTEFGKMLCSHYTVANPYDRLTACCVIANYSQGIDVRVNNPNTDGNITGFKTYLQQQYAAGTPVTVWYVLATEETAVVNEPLMRIGDYVDEVSNVSIPVTAGGDTISVGTTLQPSEVTANYYGWHTETVHERENGQWN